MNIETLKILIAERQLTIEKLANIAGVSADVIYKTLAKKRKPNLSTIGKLAAALNVSPKDLMKED